MTALSACYPERTGLPGLPGRHVADRFVAEGGRGRSLSARRAPSAFAALLTGLFSAALLLPLLAAPAVRAQVQVAALQCRLGGGPWQPCRLEVQDVGLHWVLRIGAQRIEFQHSGDGAVRMQKGDAAWQPVTASWQPDTSLCWDGVCAKGDIPLD